MVSVLWRWFMSLILMCVILKMLNAADVCVEPSPHKDVNANIAAAIVEKAAEGQQCMSRCAALKDTLPCRSAVFVETKARGKSRALCKMYGRSAKQSGSLVDVDVADLVNNDATYYDVQDQCTANSQRVTVDTAAGAQVDPSATGGPTTTINPAPGGVIIVQPGPGGSLPTGPVGPEQGGSGGIITVPPVGGQFTPAISTAAVTQAPPPPPAPPQVPINGAGGGRGGGAFVPGPNGGGGGGGAFVPGPNAGQGGSGPVVPAPQAGGLGGSGAFVPGPNGPQPPSGGGVNPQPGGGVYPQTGGGYPPPAYGSDGYNAWSPWGQCSVTCGGGVMYRNRVCGSTGCQGPDKGLRACSARVACSNWGPWTDWGPCSSPCGSGTQTRTRQCQANYGCRGSSTDSQSCSSYSSCYNPQPQPRPYVPQPVPVYIPRPAPAPAPAPQPSSYYVAIQNQYYRNRG